MIIDPSSASAGDLYRVVTSTIVPRPIAWVSTSSASGGHNLAPFSFFAGVHYSPPTLAISITHKRPGEVWVKKDSLRNIEETGELVVNVATEAHMRAINETAANLAFEVSEFERAGLTPVASDLVGAPRVAECTVSMECRMKHLVPLGEERPATLVIAQVVRFHIAEEVWDEDAGRVDVTRLKPVSRLGGTLFATIGELHDLDRPR